MKYLNRINLLKMKNISKRYPVNEIFYKVAEKLQMPYRDYSANYRSFLPTEEELEKQRKAEFSRMPLVSIVVPAYETHELFLKQMIDSVVGQTYGNWELCLADGSQSDRVQQVVEGDYAGETRIKYHRLEKNQGISENTNQGFAMAAGEYIALLDHDDLLVPSALFEMVKRVNETGADFVYSDEDKVTADLQEYMDPHFKLDFNRELLLGNNYICHFLMVSQELLQQAGGLNGQYDGAQDFEFVLRCSRYAKRMEHVRKVLYHWRVHPASTAGNTNSKLYAYEAGKRAVQDYITAQGWQGTVTMTRDLGFYRTRYEVPGNITVGILCWGKPSPQFSSIQKQLQQELSQHKGKIIWEYDFSQQADYVVILNRAVKKIERDSVSVLIGSCCRGVSDKDGRGNVENNSDVKGNSRNMENNSDVESRRENMENNSDVESCRENIGIVGARTITKGRVKQCGYWKRGGQYVARYENLPEKFKGYYRRAYLPVEVDAVSNDLVVVRADIAAQLQTEEPAVKKHQQTEGQHVENYLQWQDFCGKLRLTGQRILIEPQASVKI